MNLGEVQEMLTEWEGAYAQWWKYSALQRKLEIRLSKPGTESNRHLVCEECKYIGGPTEWPHARIEIIVLDDKTRGHPCVVRDMTASLMIRCGIVSVKADVPPRYMRCQRGV